MSLTVTFNNPAFPANTNFDVTGLGLLQNGSAKVLVAADETKFTARHGVKIEVKNASDGHWTITGTPLT